MNYNYAKPYEEQTFSDKFMFSKVMEDKELCKKVLECLLGRPVGKLKEVIAEQQMCQTEDGKMIRLDFYLHIRSFRQRKSGVRI